MFLYNTIFVIYIFRAERLGLMYKVIVENGVFEKKNQKLDLIIENAINFIKDNLNESNYKFTFKLIFPSKQNEFIKTLNKYHIEKTDKECNATTLPWFHQNKSNPNEIPIIIINYFRFIKKDSSFVTSVLIHEIIHTIDFLKINSFSGKFNLKFENNYLHETKESLFIALFFIHSEMRAKYFQEKYICCKIGVNSQIDKYIDYINSVNEIGYEIQHKKASLRCWKDILIKENNNLLLARVEKKEIEINNKYINYSYYDKIFEYNDLILYIENRALSDFKLENKVELPNQ